MYTIQQILDKIIKESDINPRHYTEEDRLWDVNQEYQELIEEIVQLGAEHSLPFLQQVETVTGVTDFSFPRAVRFEPIVQVEQTYSSNPLERDWCCMVKDTGCEYGQCCYKGCYSSFRADDTTVFIDDAYTGMIRITYATREFPLFTLPADANTIPSAFKGHFNRLLILKAAYKRGMKYNPEKARINEEEYRELKEQFRTHYDRRAEFYGEIKVDEGCGCKL